MQKHDVEMNGSNIEILETKLKKKTNSKKSLKSDNHTLSAWASRAAASATALSASTTLKNWQNSYQILHDNKGI